MAQLKDRDLASVIFGEAILNDAAAIALFTVFAPLAASASEHAAAAAAAEHSGAAATMNGGVAQLQHGTNFSGVVNQAVAPSTTTPVMAGSLVRKMTMMAVSFMTITLGSLGLGVSAGASSALMTKYVDFTSAHGEEAPHVEVALMMVTAYGAYVGASFCALSGACGYNRPCAHQYVGTSQSCML